jgi:polyhydroxyalkanoate synthesis repressor PhaR
VQLIKKYTNRKLYHTNRKQYITLDRIAALIQAGEDVRVVDNESGEDITAPILAQVVAQARPSGGLLPTHVLTDLIQASGERIAEMREAIWANFGGAALVDTEIKRRLERLHSEGALSAGEIDRLRRLLLRAEPDDAAPTPLPEAPSRGDLARLNAQIDALTAAVEGLLAERRADSKVTS